MDKPLTIWYCDVCGEKVTDIKEGYVIWKTDDDYATYDYKIIHKVKCDRRNHPQSNSLDRFLGNDGLSYLVTFLSIGTVKRNLGEISQRYPKDMIEFTDFIHRVQTPYYEQARQAFCDDNFLRDYADCNELYPYCQENLKKIIEDYIR